MDILFIEVEPFRNFDSEPSVKCPAPKLLNGLPSIGMRPGVIHRLFSSFSSGGHLILWSVTI